MNNNRPGRGNALTKKSIVPRITIKERGNCAENNNKVSDIRHKEKERKTTGKAAELCHE